jgi:hypothetical protein
MSAVAPRRSGHDYKPAGVEPPTSIERRRQPIVNTVDGFRATIRKSKTDQEDGANHCDAARVSH